MSTETEGSLKMEAEKAKPEPTTVLVTHPGQPIELSKGWSREQVDLVKSTIGKAADLTDDEFLLFVATAQRLQLDPIARQIHAVKRGGKLSIQVGIDGFRAIADRTGKCAGNSDPTFESDGDQPVTASVTVHKLVEGDPRPFTATARWAEYYPGDGKEGFMWRKMPFLMLGKCAEALALRKAFPAELGGVYAPEEMDQVGQGVTSEQPEKGPEEPAWAPPTGSPEELRKIAAGVEVPFGNEATKGRPLGDLSQEHVDRLAKWCAARDEGFKAANGRFLWALETMRTQTDDELEAARVDREPGEPEGGYV